MKNKGISLIVLVITIIIIIILAGVVILNISNNNPVENATEAKIATDLDAFKSDLAIQVGDKYLKNMFLTDEEIDSKDENGWRITDLVPSIKDTEYENELVVENSELKLKIGSKFDEETIRIIEEILGDAILTVQMIKEEPTKYIGEEISYSGYTENQDIKWRIFNVTEDGTIQLIANSHVDLSSKTASEGITVNGYNIYSDAENRTTLLNYLINSNNWVEYSVSGKTTAKGGPTLEEFINSYNMISDIDIEISSNVESATAEGYMLRYKGSTDYKYEIELSTSSDLYIQTSDDTSCRAYWIPSLSACNNVRLMAMHYNMDMHSNKNWLSCDSYKQTVVCIRPLISLTSSAYITQANGTYLVK